MRVVQQEWGELNADEQYNPREHETDVVVKVLGVCHRGRAFFFSFELVTSEPSLLTGASALSAIGLG